MPQETVIKSLIELEERLIEQGYYRQASELCDAMQTVKNSYEVVENSKEQA